MTNADKLREWLDGCTSRLGDQEKRDLIAVCKRLLHACDVIAKINATDYEYNAWARKALEDCIKLVEE